MADLSAVFVEFGKFVEQVKLEGRKVSEEDVEYFVERFLDGVQTGFPYGMQYIYGRDSSREVNRTMYTWNPVLSTGANDQAAAEAGAPRGPCWCGVYHDIRLNCPNRVMYQLNKNYYTDQGGNNQVRVSI